MHGTISKDVTCCSRVLPMAQSGALIKIDFEIGSNKNSCAKSVPRVKGKICADF
jgi:hypothetical protein